MLNPRTTRLLWRLFPLALLLLAGVLFWLRLPTLVKTLNSYPWDGKVDWLAARAFLAGKNPYSPQELAAVKLDGLGHPPTTSFWFIPLALLDMQMMSKVLGTLSILMLLAQCWLVARELQVRSAWAVGILFGVLVLYREWMRFHLHLAQISQLISFLLVLTWVALRRRRDWLAGIPLGIACTLKLFPGLVAVFILLSRRWRPIVIAALIYLTVAAIMTARFGPECWPQFIASERKVVDLWIGNMRNASLYGILIRIYSPVCVRQSGSIPQATAIASALTATLFASALLLWRRIPAALRASEPYRTDLPFMMLVVLGVFGNPFVYEHYYALLVPPVGVAIATSISAYRQQHLSRAGLIVVLVAQAATILLLCLEPWTHLNPYLLRNPAYHVGQHLWEVANWQTFVLLLLSYAVLLWVPRRPPAAQPPA
jgi:alpha-1,2-mannosyltransferase